MGKDAVGRLRRNRPWVLVALAADLAGDMPITTALLNEFRAEILNQEAWMIVPKRVSFNRATVGRRRLLADGGSSEYSPPAAWVSVAYHSDGAGAHALQVVDLRERQSISLDDSGDQKAADLVDDEMLIEAVLTGLIRLGRHARDRAGASGNCAVRVQLLGSDTKHGIEIGHTRFHGIVRSRSTSPIFGDHADAELAADIDDLADPSPELIRLTASLCDELAQACGFPELGQLSRDGVIRRR